MANEIGVDNIALSEGFTVFFYFKSTAAGCTCSVKGYWNNSRN